MKQLAIEHPVLGYIVLTGDEQNGLHSLRFSVVQPPLMVAKDGLLTQVAGMLEAYFEGEPIDWAKIPLVLTGSTFQQQVWRALQTIPYGQTVSYKWLAQQVGNPSGYRAVGNANGKNPLPIIIPCHRVISHSGQLGGYTGGLHIKQYLLSLECGHNHTLLSTRVTA